MSASEREKRTEQSGNKGLSRSSQQQPARRGHDPLGLSSGEFFSNPFSAMRRMHDEMDRMFAGAFGQQVGTAMMGGLGSWSPAVEVSEKDNQVCVCAELPGLKPEDVKVEITDEALIIEGERKHERQDNEGGRWHSERSYGRFHRTVPLPEGANADEARAEFRNGELRVTVPVQQQQNKRRQVPISGTSGEQPERK